jgi:hypothetical protein
MNQNPPEVIAANIVFMTIWLVTVLVILIGGKYFTSIQTFRNKMLAKWKPAAVIVVLFLLGMGLGGRGFINPYAIAIFCQALIGLTIASDLDFEPLPLSNAIVQRKEVFRQIAISIILSVLVVIPALPKGDYQL